MLEDKQREFTDQLWDKLQTEEESWLCFDLTRILWDTSKGILKTGLWLRTWKRRSEPEAGVQLDI